MQCQHFRFVLSVFSLAWRLAWLSFSTAAQAPTSRLKRPQPLSMPRRTPQAPTRAPERVSEPIAAHPSVYADDCLDDYDPSEPGDPWSDYLDDPVVIEACIPHLHRCLRLDPAQHDHP